MKKLTLEQKALLQLAAEGKIPDSPCAKCDMGMACCGCPADTAYREDMKPYKEAGIMNIAIQLKRAYNLQKKSDELGAKAFAIRKKYAKLIKF